MMENNTQDNVLKWGTNSEYNPQNKHSISYRIYTVYPTEYT